ncbi:MAG: hypothetical protein KIT34_05615 [Cyanobacteria bacterium TGS_CYA1]|nr:hypothetical protein [Cyanobacteria bacterium TGS_CYA1]
MPNIKFTIAIALGGLLLASFNQMGRAQDASFATKDFVMTDKARNKNLPVKVTFPTSNSSQKYPVIIFSHGALGSKDNYQPLIKYWTAHGYVCIQPTHSDSLTLKSPDERRKILFGFMQKKSLDSLDIFQDWQNRPADISFILDELSSMQKYIPELKDKIDTQRIGMAGHSFGAHTSQLLAGTKIGGTDKFSDPRPKAFLLMSPQGREQGFSADGNLKDNSWSGFKRPMLLVTGTNDTGRNGKDYTWRVEPYKYSPSGKKHLLVLAGADHGLGGISGSGFSMRTKKQNSKQVEEVQKETEAFFDYYLKGDETAGKYLVSHETK